MSDLRSDESLAMLARSGDVTAFEELYGRYKKPLINFIYRMIGNRETAEDVALDAIMRAYNSLDIYDSNRSFKTWIFTIAKNLAKNAIRDRRYFRDASLDQALEVGDGVVSLKDIIADRGPAPDEAIRSEELDMEAQAILNSMPERLREVIVMVSIQGMTYKEASEIIGCSIASISVRMVEARSLFMRRLGLTEDGQGRGGAL